MLLGKEELSGQGPRARLQLLSAAVIISAQLPNTQWLLGVPEVTAEPRGLSELSQEARRRKKEERNLWKVSQLWNQKGAKVEMWATGL